MKTIFVLGLAACAFAIRLDKGGHPALGPHRFGDRAGDIWSNCGSASDDFQIKTVVITPDPPVIGQNLTVAVTGALSTQITSGVVAVNIAWNGVPLISQNFSLCDIVTSVEKCPLNAGPQAFSVSQLLPSQTPAGSFNGTVQAFDQNNNEVFCIGLNFNLGSQGLKTVLPPHPMTLKKRGLRPRMH